ncbi:hypothetical protein J6590_040766 [Homalodisca vitripennis]|nr:hypothetical protein J6590_040766 [Homalodisca vitripennis]
MSYSVFSPGTEASAKGATQERTEHYLETPLGALSYFGFSSGNRTFTGVPPLHSLAGHSSPRRSSQVNRILLWFSSLIAGGPLPLSAFLQSPTFLSQRGDLLESPLFLSRLRFPYPLTEVSNPSLTFLLVFLWSCHAEVIREFTSIR